VGCAFVVPTSAQDADDAAEFEKALIAWSRQAMANYKVPRRVVVLDSLPLNASGKVLKRELRDGVVRGLDQASGGGTPAT
jgi:HIP---CoA ligase